MKQLVKEIKKQPCIKALSQAIEWGEIKIQVQNKEVKCIEIRQTFKE